MALNPETEFTPRINASDSDYPYGSAKNVTTPNDDTGTPFVADLVNDVFGLQQALLTEAGIVPNGQPDNVNDSDYRDALRKMCGGAFDTLTDLVASTTVKVGQIVTVAGGSAAGDGDGSVYYIVAGGTGSAPEYTDLTGSSLQARRIAINDWQIGLFNVEGMSTASVDTSLVLAPDGAGGVEFKQVAELTDPIGGCELGDSTTPNITNGGEFHSTGDTTIGSSVTVVNRVAVRVKTGDLVVNGSITSDFEVILDVDGDVTINQTIDCLKLTIRASGAVTVNAALTTNGTDLDANGEGTYATEGVDIDAAGNVTFGAAIDMLDPIVVKSGGDLTVTADITALSLFAEADGAIDISNRTIVCKLSDTFAPPAADGVVLGRDGTGGQGGGALTGTNGSAQGGGGTFGGGDANDVVLYDRGYSDQAWNTPVNNGYLAPIGTGGGGGSFRDSARDGLWRGGGGSYIVMFAAGNITATGALLDASATPGRAVNQFSNSADTASGGGGGGTVRLISKGTIAGGEARARGGDSYWDQVDGSHGGGGGNAAIICTGSSDSPTADATGGLSTAFGGGSTNGDDGTEVVVDTLTASQIDCMKSLLLTVTPGY